MAKGDHNLSTTVSWRRMGAGDVDSVLRIADEIHPDLPESVHVFAERARLFPEGCLILEVEDRVCGYAISYPIRRDQPPPLDTLLGEIAADSDQYYIHDLAILPAFRRRGFATECIAKLLAVAVAKRFPTTCLVSVYGTASFWARYGFVSEQVNERLLEKMREFGTDAVFLTRQNGT